MGFDGAAIDRETADNAEAFVEYCRTWIERDAEWGTEYRADSGRPLFFGTVGFYACRPGGKLAVVDYKTGAHKVSAFENPQPICCAILIEAMDLTPHDVEPVIVRRNLAAAGDPHIDNWTIPAEDLLTWEVKTPMPAMRGVLLETPVAFANLGKHCRYSPAKLVCSAYGDAVSDLVDRVEKSKDALRSGIEVTGFKLVAGRAPPAWKDGAEEAAEAVFGGAERTKPVFKSPAQMEKVALGRPFVAEWAYTREGAPAMVPDSDRRPALIPETSEEMLLRKRENKQTASPAQSRRKRR